MCGGYVEGWGLGSGDLGELGSGAGFSYKDEAYLERWGLV